ncbi:MAG: hypothetical protein WCK89_11520 [bacterium]
MKQVRSGLSLILAMVIAAGAGAGLAADVSALTRAQWLKKIGASVTSEAVLRETLGQVAPEEKVEFTQRVLKAVTRMPVSPEEKAAAFVRTAVACIASVTGETKYKVIAEVFAGVPVEYLPVVTEELAKRFDQEYNKLSDEQYEKVACDALKVVFARNAQTDAPSVRDTFAILAFLRGAKNPALKDTLLALLPDDRMRGLAASWLPAALDGNYESLLAAADVEALALSYADVLRLVGHANLDRLLAAMDAGIPLSSVIGLNLDTLPSLGFVQPTDFGINRLPKGYQNQTFDICGNPWPHPPPPKPGILK